MAARYSRFSLIRPAPTSRHAVAQCRLCPWQCSKPERNDNVQVLGIRTQVLADISRAELSQDWDAVIKKYGTHYVSEVRVGGLMEAALMHDGRCSSVCANQKSSKPIASVSDSIQYLSGNTGAREFEDNFIAPKAPVYSVGGDPDLGVGCQYLDACTPYNVRSWQSQVFAQSAPYAVVLTPISLLFSNGIGRMNRCLSIDTALGTLCLVYDSLCTVCSSICSYLCLTLLQAKLPTGACLQPCLKTKTAHTLSFCAEESSLPPRPRACVLRLRCSQCSALLSR